MNVPGPNRRHDDGAPQPEAETLHLPERRPVAMDIPVTQEVIRVLAGFAGLSLSDADIQALAGAVASQTSIAATLRALDLTDVPPITVLDPRWT